MKVSQINFNYNKKPQFCSNNSLSIGNWIALRDELTRSGKYSGFVNEKIITELNGIPTFKKPHFEYSDYLGLSKRERLIINIVNRKGADYTDDFTNRNNISIKKDAERIFQYALRTKEYFDKKYKNGYKLVGIGNSPAAIIETMQLLGADAVTLPFSKVQIESPCSYEFPYEHWVPDEDSSEFFPNSYYGHWEKCNKEDWEEYFKYFGINKNFSQNTGKSLIFTDYVDEGWTKKYIEAILEGIGFDKNYEFIETDCLLPPNTGLKLNYNFFRWLDASGLKDYAKMESPARYYRKVDILKHPEYIPSLPERFESKFFRCALYDLMAKM